MLYLLFELAGDHYALDVRQVVEVVPQAESRILLGPLAGVAGLMNYRGKPVPLIDLTQLLLGRACARRMSTRIVVASWQEASGETQFVGLLAERVTDTIRLKESDFKDIVAGACGSKLPGPVLTNENMMIQRVDVADLVPRSLRDELPVEIGQPRP
jgi:chemotaxis-related protein WspB